VFPSRYDHRDLARPREAPGAAAPASRPELENRTVANWVTDIKNIRQALEALVPVR
jgi:hypothetical protein